MTVYRNWGEFMMCCHGRTDFPRIYMATARNFFKLGCSHSVRGRVLELAGAQGIWRKGRRTPVLEVILSEATPLAVQAELAFHQWMARFSLEYRTEVYPGSRAFQWVVRDWISSGMSIPALADVHAALAEEAGEELEAAR